MRDSFGSLLRSFFGLGTAPPASDAPDEWHIPDAPARVVAIGDLHGDIRAFGAILTACGLVDGGARWSGGAAHLVLLGDLVGGGRGSRLLLDAVLRLEREAAHAGGRVHALLGNHDVLPAAGRFGKLTRAERALYTRYPVAGARSEGADLVDVFRGHTVYARWLRRRNAMLKIGDTLFVHAGVERWALETDPATVNDAVRAWLAHWQGVGPRPGKGSRWTIARVPGGGGGPLWTRAFKARPHGRAPTGPSRKELRAIFDRHGVTRMVVGHAPTDGRAIVLEHPHYGAAVILADTRISNERRGRMSALSIEGAKLTPIYAEDRSAGTALEAFEEAALAPRPPEGASAFGWLARIFGRGA
jgi:hypothetical protein